MRRLHIALFLLLIVLASGCKPGQEEIATEFQTSINLKSADGAVALLADGVTIHFDGIRVSTGKAEALDWLEIQAKLNFQLTGTPVPYETGAFYENCILSSDAWSYINLESLTGSCQLDMDGGSITNFDLQLDEVSSAGLTESLALSHEDILSIWTSQGVPPGGDTQTDWVYFFMQFRDNGEGRISISPEDLQSNPDADHPGAKFSWTYDGVLLTLQNIAGSEEGYCTEQDIARYLIRFDSDGQIQFKPIQEDCLWRRYTLQRVGSSWDPYVP